MIKRLGSFLLIRDQEYKHVAYFFSLFFLIGCGMALGRGTADALFFKRYGIEYLPVMYIIVSLLLCLTSLAYAAFADRIPSERFFKILFGSLICLLLCNWSLIVFFGATVSYPAYFVIYEIASELLTIHAAHYLSQNFEILQVKRLSPLIMAGTQSGVIGGGIFLASSSHTVGVQNFLLFWSLLLGASLLLLLAWHRRHGISPYFRPGHTRADKLDQAINEVRQGLKFIKSSRLLRALSFSLFFLVITFYVMCYSANRIYTNTFQSEESLTMFFGMLIAANSIIALLLQVFVTNKILRKFGAARVNLIFPVTSILSYLALMISFTFPSALLASLNKDALMTAFRNPVRNLFFNALPGNMQGRARATSVVVVLPLALTVSGFLLWIMQRMDNPIYFVALGITAATCYLFFSNKMSSAYASEMIFHLKQKLFIPESDKINLAQGGNDALFDQLCKGIRDKDNQISLDFAKMLLRSFPDKAPGLILERIEDVDLSTKDQIFKLLLPNNPPELSQYLWASVDDADSHLKATALKTLFSLESVPAKDLLASTLMSDNPRIQATAIYGVLKYEDSTLYPNALKAWEQLLEADSIGANLAALELLEHFTPVPGNTDYLLYSYKPVVSRLLASPSSRITIKTLRCLQYWPEDSFHELASSICNLYKHEDASLRVECLNRCNLLPADTRDWLVEHAIEDSKSDVRDAAVKAIFMYASDPVALLTSWLTVDNKGSPRAQRAMLTALLSSNASKDVMESIAMAKAEDAQQLLRASRMLVSAEKVHEQNSALELMRYTLNEKFLQVIDLVLLAMQTLENQDDVNVIRAAIECKDPRHAASAFEVLHSMRKQKLARLLCDILDDSIQDGKAKHNHSSIQFKDIRSMLLWCESRIDPWLQDCANQALKSFS